MERFVDLIKNSRILFAKHNSLLNCSFFVENFYTLSYRRKFFGKGSPNPNASLETRISELENVAAALDLNANYNAKFEVCSVIL